MRHRLSTAVMAAACLYLVAPALVANAAEPDPAQAQTPPAAATPATAAPAAQTPVATPAPAGAPPATTSSPPGPAAATSSTTPPGGGPLVAYVKHTKPPALIDTTPGKAAFAMVGAFAAMSAGQAIVTDNAIQDPSGDMAHDIAAAYATAHGGRVADSPILDDHQMTRVKGEDLAKESNGANYVIDVDPPGMNLIYFGLDWTHFDLLFLSVARVIDTSTGQIVAHGHCFLRTDKAGAMTHAELLANNAAALKTLIAAKSQACLVQIKAELKL